MANSCLGASSNHQDAKNCTQALEEMLSTNIFLKKLSIIKCHIQWQDMTAISNGLLVNQTLTELHLESIESEPDPILVAVASNMTISSLTLKGCHLDNRHEPLISTVLQNGTIKSLDLSNNNIESYGAIDFLLHYKTARSS